MLVTNKKTVTQIERIIKLVGDTPFLEEGEGTGQSRYRDAVQIYASETRLDLNQGTKWSESITAGGSRLEYTTSRRFLLEKIDGNWVLQHGLQTTDSGAPDRPLGLRELTTYAERALNFVQQVLNK